MEVLNLVCAGNSNREIGVTLAIELSTVKYHLYQIYGKLGVRRRTQAVAAAIYLGLITAEQLCLMLANATAALGPADL